jgi:DNA repair ATPase RecN
MRIVKLQAENIKRLTAIDITPDGTLQVIAGRNGAGKTSVLDAIWLALGGADARKDTIRPVRDGADEAHVRVDLGDLIVTRTFTAAGKTTLTVAARDGARYPSPQTMLDRLVGELSFDPLAFAQLDPRTQVTQLLELIDLPFDIDELNRNRAVAYAERTNIGRDVTRVKHQLDAMPEVDVDVQPVNVSELLADLEEAQAAVRARKQADATVGIAEARVAHAEQAAIDLEQQLTEALAVVERDRAALETVTGERNTTHRIHASAPDVDTVKASIAAADTTNDQVRARESRDYVAGELDGYRARYQELTDEIDALDESKRAGLAAANFPVDDLGFDDTGVTYRGIPFRQCSGAERLRVSLAIAMALNPRLRVIRITDGSLLDTANMALVAEMAAGHDYQVWIERVDETGSVGIVIEDGAVRELTGATS